MLRKASEAVPEGNGSIPQKLELGSGQLTLGDIYRLCEERFDRQLKRMDSFFDRMGDRLNKKFDEIFEKMRKIDQHVTRLEHGARQPYLAMEADGPADTTKTRERTEGDATATQAMRGDCFSATRVEPSPTTNSTSFGVKAGPPALPCRDDSVVESGAAAFELCLPSMEMRPSVSAGGVAPSGEGSTALGPPPTSHLFGFARLRRRIWRRKIHGLQFHPPRTTAAASSGNC